TAGARNVIASGRMTGIVSNASGLVVQGNFIGTDITGTLKRGSGTGISLGGSATIGGDSAAARNVISGNGYGVQISGGSATVQGNFIGKAADGVTALGNNGAGTHVEAQRTAL